LNLYELPLGSSNTRNRPILQVLAVTNVGKDFKVITDQLPTEITDAGFNIGTKVKLVKRITWEFGPDQTRVDVNANTRTFIQGVDQKGNPVVTFSATIKDELHRTTKGIKLSQLTLVESPSS
jgi:hypothetical protein